ncbi:Transposon protein [Abeliophyllum distichum]|uniref:Transposon protein n=1 Tax=Abeliophyllum distichum TaxID=126358 RepID=A0ABD1QEX4_9LAMI
MDDSHKSKDTDKARRDLMKLNIRHELHLYEDKERLMKPAVEYTFIDADRQKFCNFIRKVKFPDGFASNLRKNVTPNESQIIGLKSHDCHILMQRLLPVGCQAFLNKTISSTITKLCTFFKKLCARLIKVNDMVNAQQQLILILCKLERIFPPAFFDIMIHLMMHLPEEAILDHITMQRVDNDAIQLDRRAKRASSLNVSGDEYNFINDDEEDNEDDDDNDEGNNGGEFEASDTETDCPSVEYDDDTDRSNDGDYE